MTSLQARTAPPAQRARRSGLRVVAGAIALGVAAALFWPIPADAAAYRYWSYWSGTSGAWTYSPVGAGSTRPADGAVEGWRFAVSEGASRSSIAPRTAASFDTICGTKERPDGKKRVALVVDFGTSADAPPGERPPSGVVVHCAVVSNNASGAAVLLDAFTARSDQGLICGIDGYPSRECAAVVREVPDAEPSRSAPRPVPEPARSVAAPSVRDTGGNEAQTTTSGSDAPSDDRPSDSPAPTSSAAPTETSRPSPTSSPDAVVTDQPVTVATSRPSSDAGSPWGLIAAAALLATFGATAGILRRRQPR